jgi:hypothetical protein
MSIRKIVTVAVAAAVLPLVPAVCAVEMAGSQHVATSAATPADSTAPTAQATGDGGDTPWG